MGIPSGMELIVLLAVLILLFGSAKLPTAARSIGQSIRIFKAETKGTPAEEQASAPTPPQQSLPPSGPVAASAVYEPRIPEPRADAARTEEPQRHNDTIR